MSNGEHSRFDISKPFGFSLNKFVLSKFDPEPTLQDVHSALNGDVAYFNKQGVSRPVTVTQSAPPPMTSEIESVPPVVAWRFMERCDESLFSSLLENPNHLNTAESLSILDGQFSANLVASDIMSSVSKDFERKHETFIALNEVIASMKDLNGGRGPNVLHLCDASYENILLRFRGKINHLTILHNGFVKPDWDNLPAVEFSYSFYCGTIDELVEYIHNEDRERETHARARADGVDGYEPYPATPIKMQFPLQYPLDVYNNPRGAQSAKGTTHFDAAMESDYADPVMTAVPNLPPPDKYDLVYSMHDYQLFRSLAIEPLLTVMTPNGVGIMTLVSEAAMVNPIVAAEMGYSILGSCSNSVYMHDRYTTRCFKEYLLDIGSIVRRFARVGAVFGVVNSSFFPGVELKMPERCDRSFTVYGFHQALPIVHPLVPDPCLTLPFTWDVCVPKQLNVKYNSPTQASMYDLTNMTHFVVAPKSDGVTGLLLFEPATCDMHVMLLGLKLSRKIPKFVFGYNSDVLAFQIEVLVSESDAWKISKGQITSFNYKIIDFMGKSNRNLPFGVKWHLVNQIFSHDSLKVLLQSYTTGFCSSDEGSVFQPLLRTANEIVCSETGGKFNRKTSKSVKKLNIDGDIVDKLDFSMRVPADEINVDIDVFPAQPSTSYVPCSLNPSVRRTEILDGLDCNAKLREVDLYVHKGKMHVRVGRERPDRNYESHGRLPPEIATYHQFETKMLANFTIPFTINSNSPLSWGIWKFSTLLWNLVVKCHRSVDVDDDFLMELTKERTYLGCSHKKFSNKCVPCLYMREAEFKFPHPELKKTIFRARGFALSEVRENLHPSSEV